MRRKSGFEFFVTAALTVLSVTAAEPITIAPAKMRRLGGVDERFQSFNVEMVEVTGGRFWAMRVAGNCQKQKTLLATDEHGWTPISKTPKFSSGQ